MVRLVFILVWLSIGLGVTAIEGKKSPTIFEDAAYVAFSVVFWPMFPAGRAYQTFVNP